MTAGSTARFLKALYLGSRHERGEFALRSPNDDYDAGREGVVDIKAIAVWLDDSNIRTTSGYIESSPTRLASILKGAVMGQN